jgi:phosphoribosylanthranilate isomerase
MGIGIKICGITRKEDGIMALELGANSIGLNFFRDSARYVDVQTAREIIAGLPPFGLRVGVFVNPSFEEVMEIAKTVCLDTIQLHGNETPEFAEDIRHEGLRVWKAIRVGSREKLEMIEDYPCEAILLDAFESGKWGGTGKRLNWELLEGWKSPVPWILSGGLTPENVIEAIERLAPQGIDVASGVELNPGIKDPTLMETFIQRARQAAGIPINL